MHVRVNSYHAHALISAALNSTEERNVLYGCCFVVVVVVVTLSRSVVLLRCVRKESPQCSSHRTITRT